MAVRDVGPDPDWKVSILGIDVNPTALEKAAAARYSAWSLRELPPETQRRWFQEHGREVVVAPTIRDSVRFEEHNLADENPVLWAPATYDVVFCRNVLMYFTPEGARAVLARLTRALVPGGYLLLGHAETLRGLSNDFHLCHTHGTFYYRRKDTLDDAAAPAPVARPFTGAPPVARDEAPSPFESPPADASGGWIETIRRASERITALTKESHSPAGDHGPAGGAGPAADSTATGPGGRRAAPDLTGALDLLAKERYTEALALLPELSRGSVNDPDTLLLRAVLQTHRGNPSQAEATCRELLAGDEMNAGAHYLLALCRENAGDRTGAADHHHAAAYLDPTFAMPRLHTGMLARREGELETARRELGHALPLLLREEPSRLLLFGAGFTRGALVALCRAELTAAGGTP
jgi:chemotaxis protein methyltransferase CheR